MSCFNTQGFVLEGQGAAFQSTTLDRGAARTSSDLCTRDLDFTPHPARGSYSSVYVDEQPIRQAAKPCSYAKHTHSIEGGVDSFPPSALAAKTQKEPTGLKHRRPLQARMAARISRAVMLCGLAATSVAVMGTGGGGRDICPARVGLQVRFLFFRLFNSPHHPRSTA